MDKDPKEQAKIIWESWITDSTVEEECVYEEGDGEEDWYYVFIHRIKQVQWCGIYGEGAYIHCRGAGSYICYHIHWTI